jgi:hypothetical protein
MIIEKCTPATTIPARRPTPWPRTSASVRRPRPRACAHRGRTAHARLLSAPVRRDLHGRLPEVLFQGR